ncbi:MAG TPA: hypothetical protein VEX11_02795 [Acetobacteraceae bacterium]|nr:hypothetical protein [Acetobacteraceae bacterium]
MILHAEGYISLDLNRIQRLIAAGYLSPNADCPADLRNALSAVVDALPLPPPSASASDDRHHRAAA